MQDRQDMKSGGMNAQAGSDAWEGPNYANGGQPLRGRWERVHPKKATKGAERGTMSQTFVNAPSMKVPFENVRTSVTLWRVRPPQRTDQRSVALGPHPEILSRGGPCAIVRESERSRYHSIDRGCRGCAPRTSMPCAGTESMLTPRDTRSRRG
jgi:hypothetical protein